MEDIIFTVLAVCFKVGFTLVIIAMTIIGLGLVWMPRL